MSADTVADKITAELMALFRVAVESAIKDDRLDSLGSGATEKQLLEAQAEAQADALALEQAIRRAVDWGEPVARITPSRRLQWLMSYEQSVNLPSDTPLYARSHKE